MEIIRWLIAVPLIALSLWIGISQWIAMYTIPKQLNDDGKPRNYSIAPLFGGLFGAVGCLIAPHPTIQWLWWVPMVVDPGCGLLFGWLAIMGVGFLFIKVTGGRRKA